MNQAADKTTLVTPQEMAAILKVPVSWIYRRTSQGNIPHLKVGHYIRFDPEEVLAHLRSQATGKSARSRV